MNKDKLRTPYTGLEKEARIGGHPEQKPPLFSSPPGCLLDSDLDKIPSSSPLVRSTLVKAYKDRASSSTSRQTYTNYCVNFTKPALSSSSTYLPYISKKAVSWRIPPLPIIPFLGDLASETVL